MDCSTVIFVLVAAFSSSSAKSVPDFAQGYAHGDREMDASMDWSVSHPYSLAGVLVGVATIVSLFITLALCACGEKAKDVERGPTTQESHKMNGAESVAPQTESQNAEASPANGDPAHPLTQSLTVNKSAPPSPTGGGAGAGMSPSLEHSPSTNMKRTSTIDRRLPELPPIPPKVPDISETTENDYNTTYDTIKDDKKKEGGAGRKMPVANEEDEPAYNSVEDTMRGAGGGGGSVSKKGGMMGAGGGVNMDVCPLPADTVEEDNYAIVKETGRPSGAEASVSPVGAEGGTEESDYDSSYAKVKDLQGSSSNSSSHAYAVVKDKKEREHGYARVKDVHVNPSSAEGAGKGAAGEGEDDDDDNEEAPPVPHKPTDLESPENPSSPVSERAGSVSSPSSPDPGRGGGGVSPSPGAGTGPGGQGPPGVGAGNGPGPGGGGGGGGPDGPDGNGPSPGPDNAPPGAGGRREPPYTQVSARESLDSIRARQQHQHTQITELGTEGPAGGATSSPCPGAGAGAVAGGGGGGGGGGGAGGEQDFDGIYEQVDDNSVRGQNSTSPPPLPRGRQTYHGMGRGRVYEEITEDNRPRPPGATNYHEDPEPYAVVDKTHTEQRPHDTSSNSNGNHLDGRGAEPKDFDQLYAKVDKSSSKSAQPKQHHTNNNNHKRGSAGADSHDDDDEEDDFGGLYAKVDKGRKTVAVMETRGSRIPGNTSKGGTGFASYPPRNGKTQAVSSMNSYSDIYADVDDTPSAVGARGRGAGMDPLPIVENNYQSIDEDLHHQSPPDERLMHISEHRTNPELWVRREHTYQAVEANSSKKKSRHRKNHEGDRGTKKQAQVQHQQQPNPQHQPHPNPQPHHHHHHQYQNVAPVEGTPGVNVGVAVAGGKAEKSSTKVWPAPPVRSASREEPRATPNLVTVKAKNANNNHMIETLQVKETRI